MFRDEMQSKKQVEITKTNFCTKERRRVVVQNWVYSTQYKGYFSLFHPPSIFPPFTIPRNRKSIIVAGAQHTPEFSTLF